MKLFFETEAQAHFFLLMIPFGFATALCLHTGKGVGLLRLLLDLLILLFSGIGAVFLLLSAKDEALRLYHLLGWLIGALLYVCGAGRAVNFLKGKIRRGGRNQPADEEVIHHKE